MTPTHFQLASWLLAVLIFVAPFLCLYIGYKLGEWWEKRKQ